MTVRTYYDASHQPPWFAWDDEADEGDNPFGRGQTEAEAIADLKAWDAVILEDDE